MDIDFNSLDRETILNLYKKAKTQLRSALLQGEEWERIRQLERIFTDISIERHRRDRPEDFGNPAEYRRRMIHRR
jgi:hypothetical protein